VLVLHWRVRSTAWNVLQCLFSSIFMRFSSYEYSRKTVIYCVFQHIRVHELLNVMFILSMIVWHVYIDYKYVSLILMNTLYCQWKITMISSNRVCNWALFNIDFIRFNTDRFVCLAFSWNIDTYKRFINQWCYSFNTNSLRSIERLFLLNIISI
jgi:hypothetical protein